MTQEIKFKYPEDGFLINIVSSLALLFFTLLIFLFGYYSWVNSVIVALIVSLFGFIFLLTILGRSIKSIIDSRTIVFSGTSIHLEHFFQKQKNVEVEYANCIGYVPYSRTVVSLAGWFIYRLTYAQEDGLIISSRDSRIIHIASGFSGEINQPNQFRQKIKSVENLLTTNNVRRLDIGLSPKKTIIPESNKKIMIKANKEFKELSIKI